MERTDAKKNEKWRASSSGRTLPRGSPPRALSWPCFLRLLLMLLSAASFTANVLLVRALGTMGQANVWLISSIRGLVGLVERYGLGGRCHACEGTGQVARGVVDNGALCKTCNGRGWCRREGSR